MKGDIIVLFLGLFFWSGCMTGPPYLRSQGDRLLYGQLSPAIKKLVDQGSLQFGLDPQTVRLAWGRPSYTRPIKGSANARTEWVYYGTHWIEVPTWFFTYYAGVSPRLDFRMDKRGITYVRAKVIFERDRVADWAIYAPDDRPYPYTVFPAY